MTLLRPAAYPTALLVGFVLALVGPAGVSPYAALRALVLVAIGGLVVTWLVTQLVRDKDRGAVLSLLLFALLIAGDRPWIPALLIVAMALVLAPSALAERGNRRVRWGAVTRALSVVAAVFLLAIGIRGAQDGRLFQVAESLVVEFPFRPIAATAPPDEQHPDIYLLLLDGYPRSDKLGSVLGVQSSLTENLALRGFRVKDDSRSNYVQTDQTLSSLLNGRPLDEVIPAVPTDADWHAAINRADALRTITSEGYETISMSSGFEIVALRRVDRFIDTGQLNEFERVLIEMTAVNGVLDRIVPGYRAYSNADRIEATFGAADALARAAGGRRFAFIHIASPHAPYVFMHDGRRRTDVGTTDAFDDHRERLRLGDDEYARRLGEQIQYLDSRVLEFVDGVKASGRPAVVVVFSDHGSGAEYEQTSIDVERWDYDLRTANLFAIRGAEAPAGQAVLVNLLPALSSELFGTPYTSSPEEVRLYGGERFDTWTRFEPSP